ncbi:MAG TPA: hypothetical protein VMT94_09400 [Burkholderiales bacterium]|nr:hypothetical protein [Burkholderiales bacterium]
MRRAAWLLWLWSIAGVAPAADMFSVGPELWDRPRSARAVSEQPAVAQAVAGYLAQPGAQLVIHHAVAPESALQAGELRVWLMALAVDAARVRLLDDLPPGRPLALEVAQ